MGHSLSAVSFRDPAGFVYRDGAICADRSTRFIASITTSSWARGFIKSWSRSGS